MAKATTPDSVWKMYKEALGGDPSTDGWSDWARRYYLTMCKDYSSKMEKPQSEGEVESDEK